jgi:hypothetical protein
VIVTGPASRSNTPGKWSVSRLPRGLAERHYLPDKAVPEVEGRWLVQYEDNHRPCRAFRSRRPFCNIIGGGAHYAPSDFGHCKKEVRMPVAKTRNVMPVPRWREENDPDFHETVVVNGIIVSAGHHHYAI